MQDLHTYSQCLVYLLLHTLADAKQDVGSNKQDVGSYIVVVVICHKLLNVVLKVKHIKQGLKLLGVLQEETTMFILIHFTSFTLSLSLTLPLPL